MNNHLSKATVFLCLASPLFFTSCKKTHNQSCTLASVDYISPSSIYNCAFNYDPQGELIGMTQTTANILILTRSYLRSSNQCIVTTKYGLQPNTPGEIDTISTNAMGYITAINGNDYTISGGEKHISI